MAATVPLTSEKTNGFMPEDIVEIETREKSIITRGQLKRPLSANEFDANNMYLGFMVDYLMGALSESSGGISKFEISSGSPLENGGVITFPLMPVDVKASDVAAYLSGTAPASDSDEGPDSVIHYEEGEGELPPSEGAPISDINMFGMDYRKGAFMCSYQSPEWNRRFNINSSGVMAYNIETITGEAGNTYTAKGIAGVCDEYNIGYLAYVTNDNQGISSGEIGLNGVMVFNQQPVTYDENSKESIVDNSLYIATGANIEKRQIVKNSMVVNSNSALIPAKITDVVAVFNQISGMVEGIIGSGNVDATSSEADMKFTAKLPWISSGTYNLVEVKVVGIDGPNGAPYTAVKTFTVKLDGTNTEIVAGTANVVESADSTNGIDIALTSFVNDSSEVEYQVEVTVPHGLNMHLAVTAKVTIVSGYTAPAPVDSGSGSGSSDGSSTGSSTGSSDGSSTGSSSGSSDGSSTGSSSGETEGDE